MATSTNYESIVNFFKNEEKLDELKIKYSTGERRKITLPNSYEADQNVRQFIEATRRLKIRQYPNTQDKDFQLAFDIPVSYHKYIVDFLTSHDHKITMKPSDEKRNIIKSAFSSLTGGISVHILFRDT
jgi:hypothetical protein